MSGLIDEAQMAEGQPTEEQPAGSDMPGAQQALGMETGKPTAEEQAILDRIVSAGMKFLYEDKSKEAVLKMLQQNQGSPGQAVMAVGEMIMDALMEASKGSLPTEYILPALDQIMELAGEMGEKAGLFTYGEKEHEQAMIGAVGKVMENSGVSQEQAAEMLGAVPQEELAAAEARYGGMNGQQAG
jgi:hypothetical protein